MKVLLVSTNLSHPTDAGNRAAIMAQVLILKQLGCDVHFLYVDMAIRQFDDSQMMAYWGDRYHIFHQNIIGKCKRLLTDKYRTKFCYGRWSCDDHYANGLDRYVNSLNKQEQFDAIIVQYMRLSKLLSLTNIPKKAIFTHDVFSYKDLRVGSAFYETCNAHEEAKALQRCPNIFAIQEEEAIFYKFLAPHSKIYTVYNPYEFHNHPICHNNIILYLASRMEFNVNGIGWFLDNVWPQVILKNPSIKLIIAGTVCEQLPTRLHNVEILGRIDSLENFYNLGDIVINPVYQGTGLKIKTFEALAHGKTTIVHPHSTQGIFQKDKAPLLVAEQPQEWIDTIQDIISGKISLEMQKNKAKDYIEQMGTFIRTQYLQFLNN